jgi:hemin uptake protein HemP
MQTPTPPPTSEAPKTPAAVKSVDLFQGQKSIDIEHKGNIYRLQTTKLGKLILTK